MISFKIPKLKLRFLHKNKTNNKIKLVKVKISVEHLHLIKTLLAHDIKTEEVYEKIGIVYMSEHQLGLAQKYYEDMAKDFVKKFYENQDIWISNNS